MSFLLPLQPVDDSPGTSEAMSSFLFRLVKGHHTSRDRFLLDLHRWALEHGEATWHPRRFQKSDQFENGYSFVSASFGATVCKAMGASPMALNLACLVEVLPNSREGVSDARSWCPFCWQEDVAGSKPVYDRLLWFIAGVAVCPVHQTALHTTCPQCGERQVRYNYKGGLDECCFCGKNLASDLKPSAYIRRPFGQVETIWLPLLHQQHLTPTFSYQKDAPFRFVEGILARFGTSSDRDALAMCRSLRVLSWYKSGNKPTLLALTQLAVIASVDLGLALSNPEECANIVVPFRDSALTLQPIRENKKANVRIDAWQAALEREINKYPDSKPSSIALLSRSFGVKIDAMERLHPGLVSEVIRLRDLYDDGVQAHMRKIAEEHVFPAVISGEWTSRRMACEAIASMHGLNWRSLYAVVRQIRHPDSRAYTNTTRLHKRLLSKAL